MNRLIQSHKQHKNWLLAIDLIKALNELCLDIRSHRGTSTAQLEGDGFFETITDRTAESISSTFVEMDDKRQTFLAFEAYDTFLEVVQLWLDIQLNWKKEKAFDNFQKHSLLLEKIQQLIWTFSDYYMKQINDCSDKSKMMHFLLKTHFSTMEAIARLRGLGCFYCAKRYLSAEDKKIIREEIKTAYLLWSERGDEQRMLPLDLKRPLNQHVDTNNMNRAMADFTQLLEEVLHNTKHTPNGSEVFNAGSKVLSAMNMQFNCGLEALKQYLPQDLNRWINNGADEVLISQASHQGSATI